MIKGFIQEEDRTIVNMYAPNTEVPQYIRQMVTSVEGEVNNNAVTVGAFNTPCHQRRGHLGRKQANISLKWHNKPGRFNSYFSGIPSQSSRVHLPLTSTGNTSQDRSHLGSQIKPRCIFKHWNHIKYLFWPQPYEIRNILQGKKQTQTQKGETTCYQTTNQSLKKSKEEIIKYRDKSRWKHKYPNAKAALRGFIALESYLRKQETSQRTYPYT